MLEFLATLFKPAAPEWDGAENRQTFRARCEFEIEVGIGQARYLGKAVDAGPQGLKIRIRGPFKASAMKPNTPAALRYLEPLFDAQLDSVKAKVRWAKKEGEGVFVVGVMFDEAPENLVRSWVKPVLTKLFQQKTKQKRKTLRVHCNLPISFVYGGKTLQGHLRDLSAGGALLESLVELPADTEISFAVGPLRDSKLPRLALTGKVQRTRKPLGTFLCGLRIHPAGEEKKALMLYLRHFAAANVRSRV